MILRINEIIQDKLFLIKNKVIDIVKTDNYRYVGFKIVYLGESSICIECQKNKLLEIVRYGEIKFVDTGKD